MRGFFRKLPETKRNETQDHQKRQRHETRRIETKQRNETITTLIIEVGGRDINLAIGPLFDDVTINVLYNTISTIVTQSITSVEMWVAYGGSTETEIIDIVDNIIEHNDFIEQPNGEIEMWTDINLCATTNEALSMFTLTPFQSFLNHFQGTVIFPSFLTPKGNEWRES